MPRLINMYTTIYHATLQNRKLYESSVLGGSSISNSTASQILYDKVLVEGMVYSKEVTMIDMDNYVDGIATS